MTPIAARCRMLLAGLATSALLAAPATAAAATETATPGCPETPLAQPFAAWGDEADYFLAPDGGFEADAAGWALRAHAGVVNDNEPFHVVAGSDTRSLRLPAGSAAVSPPFCIGAEHRTMRFFARAAASSSLNVSVLYEDSAGQPRQVAIGALAGAGEWAPSDVVPMVVDRLAAERGSAMTVRLRFAPHGAETWTIDDVHVDPYRMR